MKEATHRPIGSKFAPTQVKSQGIFKFIEHGMRKFSNAKFLLNLSKNMLHGILSSMRYSLIQEVRIGDTFLVLHPFHMRNPLCHAPISLGAVISCMLRKGGERRLSLT